MSSTQTIVLITGANQGVGFETAKNLALSSSSYHILVGSRSFSNGEEAVAALHALDLKGTVSPIQIDVTSDASVEAASKLVANTHGRLDVLINNAGIVSKSASGRAALRESIETNTIGPVIATDFFTPLLRKSLDPRLIFVTSSLGSITHAANPESPYYQSKANMHFSEYRASKAALNMLMVQYSKTLGKEHGFKIWAADPGPCVTNLVDAEMVRKVGAPEPSVGGLLVASVVKGERDADVGRVVGRYGIGEW